MNSFSNSFDMLRISTEFNPSPSPSGSGSLHSTTDRFSSFLDKNVGHAKRTAVFGLNSEDDSRRSLYIILFNQFTCAIQIFSFCS